VNFNCEPEVAAAATATATATALKPSWWLMKAEQQALSRDSTFLPGRVRCGPPRYKQLYGETTFVSRAPSAGDSELTGDKAQADAITPDNHHLVFEVYVAFDHLV
jgi:hypothetical protein